MATVQMNVRIDETLKTQVNEVCSIIGISANEAIKMFLRQMVAKRGLPIPVSVDEMIKSNLPVLELSDEGYQNMVKAMNQPEHFRNAYQKQQKWYEEFKKTHNIEVEE